MKGKTPNFIAFDIGSSKIAAIASQISKQGEIFINSQILQYSEGTKSSIVTNMEKAETSIITAIYSLENTCDKSINEVAISLSGSGIKSYYVQHKIKLGNNAITKQDIKNLLAKALGTFKVKNKDIIHYYPIEFIIDGKQFVEDPVGLHAQEISCQLHIIAADSMTIMNLTKCLAKCNVEVSDIIVSIYASAIACLTNDEKELGSIIIDIGSNTTSFAVFLDKKIIYVGHLEMGGHHITTDIAKAFSLSMKTAEKLKILYGNTDNNSLIKNTTINLNEFEPENYNNSLITNTKLSQTIRPRMKEILLKVKKKCDELSMNHLLAQRVVITGGGAALSGLKNLSDEIFQKQTRIAKAEILEGFEEDYNPYMYSTAIGMIKSKALQYQKNYFKHNDHENAGWIKRTFLWLKENI